MGPGEWGYKHFLFTNYLYNGKWENGLIEMFHHLRNTIADEKLIPCVQRTATGQAMR